MTSLQNLIRIDKLFWIPYSMGLVIFKKVRKHNKYAENKNGKVIILKLLGMGSIIKLASVFEDFGVDKKKISLITFIHNTEICNLLGFHQNIYLRSKNPLVFIIDLIRTLLKSKKLRPNYIIDLERCSNAVGIYRLFMALLSRSKTISFGDKNFIMKNQNDLIFSMKNLTHEELFLKILPYLKKNERARTRCDVQVDSSKILVNVNASEYVLARRYPGKSYIKLIEAIHLWKSDLTFYLTGSQSEFRYVQQLTNDLYSRGINVRNVAGKWSLEMLTIQLSKCQLFITNDSGPMHLAAHLQIPTVVIWGPTHYKHFGYENTNYMYNVSLEMICSPCFTNPKSNIGMSCKGKINCIKDLYYEIVLGKVKFAFEHLGNFRSVAVPEGISLKVSIENEKVIPIK
ncbi:MAG: hypothetical protein O6940_10665 [Ignavibacteria bacterium]|nr:hypothetical protein [Ignavibacteria bacterium]